MSQYADFSRQRAGSQPGIRRGDRALALQGTVCVAGRKGALENRRFDGMVLTGNEDGVAADAFTLETDPKRAGIAADIDFGDAPACQIASSPAVSFARSCANDNEALSPECEPTRSCFPYSPICEYVDLQWGGIHARNTADRARASGIGSNMDRRALIYGSVLDYRRNSCLPFAVMSAGGDNNQSGAKPPDAGGKVDKPGPARSGVVIALSLAASDLEKQGAELLKFLHG